jgi:Uma2 family endonuclease
MTARIREQATYEDLVNLPENMVGEIIEGELFASPRPGGPHARFASVLGMDIGPAYDRGRGGPGGWWIIDEPELHLGRSVLVPDLAGWRRERMPRVPQDHVFSISPDWICEVLSPSTSRLDRAKKMPIYARHEVMYAWLVDPVDQYLEVRRLEGEKWVEVGTFSGSEKVRAEPFPEVELDLESIWGPAQS